MISAARHGSTSSCDKKLMLSLGPTLLMLSLQIKSNLMKCSKTVELRANHQSMSLISKQNKNRILEHGCIMLYRSNTYWMKVNRVSLHSHGFRSNFHHWANSWCTFPVAIRGWSGTPCWSSAKRAPCSGFASLGNADPVKVMKEYQGGSITWAWFDTGCSRFFALERKNNKITPQMSSLCLNVTLISIQMYLLSLSFISNVN
jgi:hypothetical protein